jgi:hypothetical protein
MHNVNEAVLSLEAVRPTDLGNPAIAEGVRCGSHPPKSIRCDLRGP